MAVYEGTLAGASWVVGQFATNPWAKDISLIVIWPLLIIGGTVLLLKHPWRKDIQQPVTSQIATDPPPAIECTREHLSPEQALCLRHYPEYQHQAGVYNTLVHDDYENRRLLYEIARDRPADWSHAWPKMGSGRIDFHGKIRISTIYSLALKNDPSGNAEYKIVNRSGQGEMDRPPEWADKGQEVRIHRGQWVSFVLRQRLSPEVINDLQGAVGEKVVFDFSKVKLVASTTTPEGSEAEPWTITLPGEWVEDGPPLIP